MSLNVYRTITEIPEGVKYIKVNDSFFNGKTVLPDNNFTRLVLREIDKAEYDSSLTFKGRTADLGALGKQMLSTGSKTALNVSQFPEYCFDLCECGDNAKNIIFKLEKGSVLLSNVFLLSGINDDCDVVYRQKSYLHLSDLFSVFKEEDNNYVDDR